MDTQRVGGAKFAKARLGYAEFAGPQRFRH